jgi:hypothetical protein
MKKSHQTSIHQLERPRKSPCGEESLAADTPVLAGKLAPNEAPGRAFSFRARS